MAPSSGERSCCGRIRPVPVPGGRRWPSCSPRVARRRRSRGSWTSPGRPCLSTCAGWVCRLSRRRPSGMTGMRSGRSTLPAIRRPSVARDLALAVIAGQPPSGGARSAPARVSSRWRTSWGWAVGGLASTSSFASCWPASRWSAAKVAAWRIGAGSPFRSSSTTSTGMGPTIGSRTFVSYARTATVRRTPGERATRDGPRSARPRQGATSSAGSLPPGQRG
jgi:hypothetical protein